MITHKGKQYARVSDILKRFSDFSHINPVVLGRKQIIGTQVHNAIEEWIKGGFPLLSPQTQGYFKSFLSWQELSRCRYQLTEERFFCDDKRITGKIDALGFFDHENTPVLLDWKTSAQESSAWILQGHLYRFLLESSGIYTSPRFLFLKLDPKGGYPRAFEYNFNKNILYKCFEAIDLFWEENS